jgi:hypothetical protein
MPEILPSMQINVQYIRHEVHEVVHKIPVRPVCAEFLPTFGQTSYLLWKKYYKSQGHLGTERW